MIGARGASSRIAISLFAALRAMADRDHYAIVIMAVFGVDESIGAAKGSGVPVLIIRRHHGGMTVAVYKDAVVAE